MLATSVLPQIVTDSTENLRFQSPIARWLAQRRAMVSTRGRPGSDPRTRDRRARAKSRETEPGVPKPRRAFFPKCRPRAG